jgi:hypothetical protein
MSVRACKHFVMKKNRHGPVGLRDVPVYVASDTYLDAYAAIRKLQRLANDRPDRAANRAVSREAARRLLMLEEHLRDICARSDTALPIPTPLSSGATLS